MFRTYNSYIRKSTLNALVWVVNHDNPLEWKWNCFVCSFIVTNICHQQTVDVQYLFSSCSELHATTYNQIPHITGTYPSITWCHSCEALYHTLPTFIASDEIYSVPGFSLWGDAQHHFTHSHLTSVRISACLWSPQVSSVIPHSLVFCNGWAPFCPTSSLAFGYCLCFGSASPLTAFGSRWNAKLWKNVMEKLYDIKIILISHGCKVDWEGEGGGGGGGAYA